MSDENKFEDVYKNKNVGSTATPTTITTGKAYVNSIEFLENESPANVVEELSQNYQEFSHKKIPSSHALFEALSLMQGYMEKIYNKFVRDNSVVALSSIPTDFTDTWEKTGDWMFGQGKAVYENLSTDLNYIKIPNIAITTEGYHFLVIDIQEIMSGKLVLRDYQDRIIGEASHTGLNCFEVYVENPDIWVIRISAEGVNPGERIILDSFGFHHVASRFRNYFNWKIAQYASGGSGGANNNLSSIGVTGEQVERIVDDAIREAKAILNQKIYSLEDDINLHKSDYNNPHHITLSSLGGATKDHTHQDMLEAIDKLNLHASDKITNPHDITIAKIGAAPQIHNHDELYALIEHQHDDIYFRESTIKALIETGVKDYITRIVSEQKEQEDIYTSTINPIAYVVANSEFRGIEPIGTENTILTDPITPIITNKLLHLQQGDYDYYEGAASTNKITMDHHPVRYAFKHHLNEVDRFCNVAAWYSEVSDVFNNDQITVAEYEFHTEREISGYTIYNDSTSKILGFPTKFRLVVNNKIISEFDDRDWARDLLPTSRDVYLDDPVKGQKFTFIVDRIKGVLEPEPNLYTWGFRIEFHFSDVGENEIRLNQKLDLVFAPNNKFTIENLSLPLDVVNDSLETIHPNNVICESNTPLYLYVTMDREIPDDGGDPIYTPRLSVSQLRPEYGPYRSGIPLFEDRFKGKREHEQFGHITLDGTTKEDINHPIQNIYTSDPEEYFSTLEFTGNERNFIITHEWNTPMDMTGYQFCFNKNYREYIPDKWKITLTCSDWISETGTHQDTKTIVVEEIENFFGKIIDNNSPYIWHIVKFPNVYPKVKKIKIELICLYYQKKIVISKFSPMFSGWFYNPYTCQSTHLLTAPLGRIEFVRSEIDNFIACRHTGLTQGRVAYIPIDGFRRQTVKQHIRVLPNPFGTRDVTTEVLIFSYDKSVNPPFCYVDKVTEDNIYVLTGSTHRFALKVCRLW